MKQATRQCYDVCQYEVILQHRSEHRSEGEMRNEGRHDSMMNGDGDETLWSWSKCVAQVGHWNRPAGHQTDSSTTNPL